MHAVLIHTVVLHIICDSCSFAVTINTNTYYLYEMENFLPIYTSSAAIGVVSVLVVMYLTTPACLP